MWLQRILTLAPRGRGFHLVSGEVREALPELSEYRVGLLHLFLQHTSASLAINENADPDVRGDLERHFNVMVPENAPHYAHTLQVQRPSPPSSISEYRRDHPLGIQHGSAS